jgi:hypothetical protein
MKLELGILAACGAQSTTNDGAKSSVVISTRTSCHVRATGSEWTGVWNIESYVVYWPLLSGGAALWFMVASMPVSLINLSMFSNWNTAANRWHKKCTSGWSGWGCLSYAASCYRSCSYVRTTSHVKKLIFTKFSPETIIVPEWRGSRARGSSFDTSASSVICITFSIGATGHLTSAITAHHKCVEMATHSRTRRWRRGL